MRHYQRFESGRKAVPEVRESLASSQGGPGVVGRPFQSSEGGREWSGDYPGGPGVVERPSQRSGVVGKPPWRFGIGRRPSRRSESGRETLNEVREWSGVLPEVQEWLGGPQGGLGVIGRPPIGPRVGRRHSRRSGSGREALPAVRERSGALPVVRERSVCPNGGPGAVGKPSWRSVSGRE